MDCRGGSAGPASATAISVAAPAAPHIGLDGSHGLTDPEVLHRLLYETESYRISRYFRSGTLRQVRNFRGGRAVDQWPMGRKILEALQDANRFRQIAEIEVPRPELLKWLRSDADRLGLSFGERKALRDGLVAHIRTGLFSLRVLMG